MPKQPKIPVAVLVSLPVSKENQMRAKRRMTGAEFEAVRPLLKISPNRIEAARSALVDGLTLKAVGEHYGWSKQAVGDAVSVVWRTLENYHAAQSAAANAGALLPPGWEQVTLIAPRHLIAKFRGEIANTSPQPVKTKPTAKPAAKLKAKPAAKPAAKPKAKPAAKPAAKPKAKP